MLVERAPRWLARLLVPTERCETGFRSGLLTMLYAISFIDNAAAQVVIPHGDFDNDFAKYLVAAITLAALIFAMWRYFRNRG